MFPAGFQPGHRAPVLCRCCNCTIAACVRTGDAGPTLQLASGIACRAASPAGLVELGGYDQLQRLGERWEAHHCTVDAAASEAKVIKHSSGLKGARWKLCPCAAGTAARLAEKRVQRADMRFDEAPAIHTRDQSIVGAAQGLAGKQAASHPSRPPTPPPQRLHLSAHCEQGKHNGR